MRYASQGDAFFLRKKALDPSKLVSRRRYALPVPGRGSRARHPNVTLSGFGCGCGGGLSGLGASPLTGQVASTAVAYGTRAGVTAGTAALIGTSFAPVIGTVVGVVAGYLMSKLFGHANYPAVANDVAKTMQLAEAYKQVAGRFPGRVYGVDELRIVWYGLMHEGIFPKNPASFGWTGAGPKGYCDYNACISGARDSKGNCPGCGGHQDWVDDVFTVGGGGNPLQSFKGAVAAGNSRGIANPVQVATQIFIPAWAPPDGGSKNIKWLYPGNSTNPSLVQQLIIDTLDATAYAANNSLPIFYGSLPSSATPTPAVVTPAPVPIVQSTLAPAPMIQPVTAPAPVIATLPPTAAGFPIAATPVSLAPAVALPVTQVPATAAPPAVTTPIVGASYNPVYGSAGAAAPAPSAVPQPIAAGSGFGIDNNTLLLLLGALAVSFALARPSNK